MELAPGSLSAWPKATRAGRGLPARSVDPTVCSARSVWAVAHTESAGRAALKSVGADAASNGAGSTTSCALMTSRPLAGSTYM